MTYTCYKTKTPIAIDGKIDKKVWDKAPWSPRFVDLISGQPAFFDTRVKCLWDERNLYVAFWAQEPFVAGQLTERDSIIFGENDLEVFIDGGDTYYEFEINALNTVYEVFYIYRDAYKKGGRFDVPEFDLIENRARSFGGNYDRSIDHFWRGKHRRGDKWAFINWDFPGLQTAVRVDGVINDPTHIDNGWSCELAFPWAGMKWLDDGKTLPPIDGQTMRLLFARFEQLPVGGKHVSCGWGLDPVGDNDNHAPERFSTVLFSERYAEEL